MPWAILVREDNDSIVRDESINDTKVLSDIG